MANLLNIRSQELMAEFIEFQRNVYKCKPALAENLVFQFTIKLNKKGNWICQCLSEPKEVEIAFCRTSMTLLKRLSYLSNNGRLDFAQDSENSKEFHVAIKNQTQREKRVSKTKQLQFML